jgi:hypothetical protein
MSRDLSERAIAVLAHGDISRGVGSSEISDAMQPAVDYLLRSALADGHWEDWPLPNGLGASDVWITAYVGIALAEATAVASTAHASAAATAAATWLQEWRDRHGRWTWNANFPPDAESVALGLALQQAVGLRPREDDVFFVLQCWLPQGGFGIYRSDAAPGTPFYENTGLVLEGLPPRVRRAVQPVVTAWLRRALEPDGTWPVSWWERRHFGAWHGWRALGPPAPVPHVDPTGPHATPTAFDFACLVGRAGLRSPQLAAELAAELIRHQNPTGGWDGGPTLRAFALVDDPSPTVSIVSDVGIATTATAVRALSALYRILAPRAAT